MRLQAAKVSATTVGERRSDCGQDVANRGSSVSVEDQVERSPSAQSHQVACLVDRLVATRQRPQEREDWMSHACYLLGQLRQNQVTTDLTTQVVSNIILAKGGGTATHCNLRPPDVMPVILGFNDEARNASACKFNNSATFAEYFGYQ